jgi:hypothetical protein
MEALMRNFISYLLLIMTFIIVSAVSAIGAPLQYTVAPLEGPRNLPIKSKHWDRDTKIWLARSCVGEAGFGVVTDNKISHDECMAIAWVYATRAKQTGWRLQKVIRRYSAAIKRHSTHQRPWLMELNAQAHRPPSFPNTLNWRYHRKLWKDKLAWLDRWARGHVANPVPNANHYGGDMDAYRVESIYRWKRLPAPKHFKNRFYTSYEKTNMAMLGRFGNKSTFSY